MPHIYLLRAQQTYNYYLCSAVYQHIRMHRDIGTCMVSLNIFFAPTMPETMAIWFRWMWLNFHCFKGSYFVFFFLTNITRFRLSLRSLSGITHVTSTSFTAYLLPINESRWSFLRSNFVQADARYFSTTLMQFRYTITECAKTIFTKKSLSRYIFMTLG